VQKLQLFAIEDARHRLERKQCVIVEWSVLDSLMPEEFSRGKSRRSGLASTLSATLEMVRDGHIELRQMAAFAPLYVRRREQAPAPAGDNEAAT
jgi:segregation and condensation protein A